MRFLLGPPPPDQGFLPIEEGWFKLREPSPILLQVIAVPVMLLTVATLVPAWRRVAPDAFSGIQLAISNADAVKPTHLPVLAILSLGVLVCGLAALVAVHEVIHAAAFPGGIWTSKTFIGAWPSRLLFYAAHHGAMSRNRFLWVLFVPTLILTIIPLALAGLFSLSHPLTAAASIVNGAFACGDLVGILLVAVQVPSQAIVRNQGWQTWWRLPEEPPPMDPDS